MFEWALTLHDRELKEPFPIRELDVDVELDTVSALLTETCALLEDSGIAELVLRCGGEERWPATILGELSMLLEELVPALRALREPDGQFRFELSEQGVETAIEATRRGDAVSLFAVDLWDGRPSRFGSANELVPVDAFAATFERLTDAFGEAVRRACPAVIDEELFGAWVRDVRRGLVELRRSKVAGADETR